RPRPKPQTKPLSRPSLRPLKSPRRPPRRSDLPAAAAPRDGAGAEHFGRASTPDARPKCIHRGDDRSWAARAGGARGRPRCGLGPGARLPAAAPVRKDETRWQLYVPPARRPLVSPRRLSLESAQWSHVRDCAAPRTAGTVRGAANCGSRAPLSDCGARSPDSGQGDGLVELPVGLLVVLVGEATDDDGHDEVDGEAGDDLVDLVGHR